MSGFHLVDGGYLTWLYGSKPFARGNWPPQSIRGAILALDCLDDTFRKRRDPEYKANRIDKRHEDPAAWATWHRIRELRREVVEDPRLNCVRVPGLEADDVIALAAWKFKKLKPIKLLAQDKDLLQIKGLAITDNQEQPVNLKRFSNRLPKTITTHPLKREQIPLILALLGDKSDNIPRVVSRGDLWRLAEILHQPTLKQAYDKARKDYGNRFLTNLYAVILPDPEVFGFNRYEVFDVVSQGAWGQRLLLELRSEYKEQVATWKL